MKTKTKCKTIEWWYRIMVMYRSLLTGHWRDVGFVNSTHNMASSNKYLVLNFKWDWNYLHSVFFTFFFWYYKSFLCQLINSTGKFVKTQLMATSCSSTNRCIIDVNISWFYFYRNVNIFCYFYLHGRLYTRFPSNRFLSRSRQTRLNLRSIFRTTKYCLRVT